MADLFADAMPLEEVFLNPGELVFSKKPVVLKTVLGSCVAVCLHDTEHHWGAMCHYLLPTAPSDLHRSTKYGDIAIKVLLHRFLVKHKSRREKLVATIIGGAFIVFDEREIFLALRYFIWVSNPVYQRPGK